VRSLIQFLSDLRALGIVLSLDGERLICNSPKGAMTPETRKELADRKPEIMAFLRESASLSSSRDEGSLLVDLPLSRAQQRLWFFAQLDSENPVYNIVITLRLTGDLDRSALERSLYTLVERHESLRTAFYEKNGKPLARIIDAAAWKSEFVDLSLLSPQEAENEARRLAHNQARKPFPLERAPLFRATLFRTSEHSHLLLLVVHHIVADGWSLGILAKELGALYTAFVTGQNPGLAEIAFQYRDYVRWEQDVGEEAAAKQMPYWLDRLGGTLPVLELSWDRSRPSTQTFAGKRTALTIDPLFAKQIRELCRRTGTTPFMLLLAAFKALLSRYTGLEDILVGSGTSNRQRQEFAPLVGFFVNTLVLRTDLSGDPTFSDLLTRMQETALATYAHQDVPFDLLVEKLQPKRGLSRSPLVQVIFTFQNVPMEEIVLPGLKVEPELSDPGIARADISLEVWPDGEGYRCDFEYSTDILDERTVQEMQSQYHSFLEYAVTEPSLPIADILDRAGIERRQITNGRSTAEHPLSRSQQRLWFLDQLDPGNPVYNIAVAFNLRGRLNPEAFEKALRTIVDRHESLRTSFVQREGSPYALIENAQDWQMQFTDISSGSDPAQPDEVIRFLQAEARHPFVLDQGSLFKASLFKTGAEEYVALLVMHHIISDGWSLGVLSQELSVIYASLVREQDVSLPPPPFQFRDFVAWEQKESESPSRTDMQYWRKQLAGDLPELELATDYPRPPRQTFHGRRVTTDIPSDLVHRLQKMSREQNATFFMVLLAAFNVLLRHYSRQEDILVGTPTAGRSKTSFEGIVGFFVNNLVLRADLRGTPQFVELVRRVQKTALEAFEHQSIPFDQLVEVLQPERRLDRSPIFQVMFSLQNVPLSPLRLDNVETTLFDFQDLRARYDLAVDVYLFEDNYRCIFEYNTDIFEEGTVRQMQQHYLNLLEAVVSDPKRPINELSMMSEGELHQVLEDWNRTEMPAGPYATVAEWFHAQAVKSPDAPAVEMGEKTISYAELDEQSDRLARVLRAHNVRKETIVAIYLQRSPEMVVALLGILKAGAAYLPLDPALPAQRIEFLLSDSAVPLILTHTGLCDTLPVSEASLLMIDRLDEDMEQPVTDGPGSEDLAYLIYTSGSTGNPKGTEISHGALVNLLTSMLREPGLSSEDTLVAITTLSFDIAALEIFGPLVCGAKLVLASRNQVLDPELLAGLIENSRATVMQATPSTWRTLVEYGWMGQANLRMWCGGEALPPDLAENLLARGRELWNLYGPTETTIWSAAHRVRNGENPILIGRPIGNTRMYILDADSRLVSIGVPGELYIGGNGVARGYWRRPELTETRFVADPFDTKPGRRMYRTGDLARYRRDGQIQLIGRTDHQIKLRGHRIELGEIETVIGRHPEVLQAVVALHGQGSDAQIIAYVKQSTGQVDATTLRAWLQAQLPEYMVPSAFLPISEIPLTPNGKVDRKRLPQPKGATRESSTAKVNPRSRVEEQLAKVWSDVLGVDRVGVRDNFFDLGGHSLLLIRVHARLKQELDADVAVVDLFRYPTIESMAAWLERRHRGIALAAGGVNS